MAINLPTPGQAIAFLRSPCTIPSHKGQKWRDWIITTFTALVYLGEGFDPERPMCGEGWESFLIAAIGRHVPGVVLEWENDSQTLAAEYCDWEDFRDVFAKILEYSIRGNESTKA